MRVAVGGYLVTANTFATQRISLERFQRSTLSGADLLARLGRGDGALAGFLHGAREHKWDVAPLHYMFPGLLGKVREESHQWAKETFLNALRQGGKIDGVFLQLHGTAVADRTQDCEGDLLSAIRGVVGERTPIIASLDGHANVTPLMVQQASMLIGVKTNPHYDFLSVGRQAAGVMAGMFDGSVVPVSAWAQPAIVPPLQKLYIAPGWPMEHLMRLARARAATDSRVLDVSLLGGFFVSERPETGISVVATTNQEPGLAVERDHDR